MSALNPIADIRNFAPCADFEPLRIFGVQVKLSRSYEESALKNIQIVDGADNATFSIFQATDEEFAEIFPDFGQDMEISEDFFERVGESRAREILEPMWERPILKRDVQGLHGTIFYDYALKRQHIPKTKREIDLDDGGINAAQRRLFAGKRITHMSGSGD